MNSWFARLYGPQGFRDCPMCRYEAEVELGPVQGCDPPPYPLAGRLSMSREEWAGQI